MHANPLTKMRGRAANIYRHIKHLALGHSHQFALGLLYLVVQATQYALGRAAVVILNKSDIQACDLGKVVGVEGLEEKTSAVTKDLGLQDEHTR